MSSLQLTVPEPCHQNWHQMKPEEKGRFCAACQKTVIDFRSMSDRDLAAFFKQPASGQCGRFRLNQLNRNLDLSGKRSSWSRYFFRIWLPALLMTAKAQAQGRIVSRTDTVTLSPAASKNQKKEPAVREVVVRGKITCGPNPIPHATVSIRGTNHQVVSDVQGVFSIQAPLGAFLLVTAIGYVSREVQVGDDRFQDLNMIVLQEEVMGELVMIQPAKKKKKDLLIKQIADTSFKRFSVFPSPARNNSSIKLDLGRMENGEYVVSLITMGGEVLQTDDRLVEEKKKSIDIFLRNFPAGAYLVHLFNRRTAASFTEKIIVQ